MNESLLYRTNEFVIRWVFFALMLTATELGFRLGRKFGGRTPESIKSQISTVEAGILGILALLLGFTMSMAVSRFETPQATRAGRSRRHRYIASSRAAYPRPGRS